MRLLSYFKKYPFSWVVTGVVIYLSFFKPPTVNVPIFTGWDKLVHLIMYGGMSGIIWLEFLWNHRKDTKVPVHHAIIGAMICPIFFSGIIELLQENMTVYRAGDWLDLLANTTGVLLAAFIAWYIIRPRMFKKFGKKHEE